MVVIAENALVYLDTNILIYITEGDSELKNRAEEFLQFAVQANARLVTSELAITEVLVLPLKSKDELLLEAYNALFDSWIDALPIQRSMLIVAAQLRATTHRLRTPDAIHVATAMHVGADYFVTGDKAILVEKPMIRHVISL